MHLEVEIGNHLFEIALVLNEEPNTFIDRLLSMGTFAKCVRRVISQRNPVFLSNFHRNLLDPNSGYYY